MNKITKEEKEEFEREVERLYNDWIYKEEKRNISYGEMAYIQNLSFKELNKMYDELVDELYKED